MSVFTNFVRVNYGCGGVTICCPLPVLLRIVDHMKALKISVAARGCLPLGANVCVAAPANQMAIDILMVTTMTLVWSVTNIALSWCIAGSAPSICIT